MHSTIALPIASPLVSALPAQYDRYQSSYDSYKQPSYDHREEYKSNDYKGDYKPSYHREEYKGDYKPSYHREEYKGDYKHDYKPSYHREEYHHKPSYESYKVHQSDRRFPC